MPDERRVDGAQVGDAFPDLAEQGQGGAFLLVQQAVGVGGQGLQAVGMAQHVALALQRLVLPIEHVGLSQLGQVELDEFQPAGTFPGVELRAGERLRGLADRRPRGRHGGRPSVEAGPRVEHRQMSGRIEQRLVFVLPVQFDQLADQRLEGRGVDQLSVDEGSRAPLSRDLAPHEHLASVGGLELRFHRGEIFAGADQVGGSASAQEEAHGFDEHRLAGTRFAGQDIERSFKLDAGRLDDRKVLDRQVPNHRREPGAGRAPVVVGTEVPSYHGFDRSSHDVLRWHTRAVSQRRITP